MSDRAIKFRAWDNENKRFYYDIEEDDFSGFLFNDQFVVEQFTGLLDKNGKEIYEGDIVLDYHDGDDAFVVEWDKDTASFRLTGTDNIASVSFDNFYSDKDLEVIGNVHEDRELFND